MVTADSAPTEVTPIEVMPTGETSTEVRLASLMRRLYPICRSVTGNGTRQTLAIIGEQLPLQITEVPSGTAACDWTVNDEWNITDAYVADPTGHRVIDFRQHNLHVVNYSTPVRTTLTLSELRPHLFTLPEHPDWIPYRTTYYNRTWGFCLSQRQLEAMDEGPYEVVIDSTLEPGAMTYGELVIPGDTDEEVIFSAHVCHPSLANDNLSGIAVAAELAKLIMARPARRYRYRFLFAPGTIGSITWLSRNPEVLPQVRRGVVLSGVGGPGPLIYKKTRRGNRDVDLAASHVVRHHGGEIRDYSPYGYDERQFNSLGFDLPVGRLTRTPHGEYPEYHTSADNLDFVRVEALLEALAALEELVSIFEGDGYYRNAKPYGEPQLGKRGLYPTMGGKAASDAVMAMLWTLAYADGHTSLLAIAERSGLPFAHIKAAADDLAATDLLEPA